MATLIELTNLGLVNTGACDSNLLVNKTIQDYLWEDKDTRDIDAIMNPIYAELYAKIRIWNDIGKDVVCLYQEISYLQALTVWFIELKSMIGLCTSLAKFDEFASEMKIDCIRETLNCNYGRGKLIDKIVSTLALDTPLIGIGYMTIDDDSCQVFKID